MISTTKVTHPVTGQWTNGHSRYKMHPLIYPMVNSEQRKARDTTFAELLVSMNPASALRREMIAARMRARLTQGELARRMGTTQSVIARLELGGRSPNIKTLRRLAQVTGSRLVVRLDAGDFSCKRKYEGDDL
jgi:ribosome-binding protein aMBF1 (putative translation factor)